MTLVPAVTYALASAYASTGITGASAEYGTGQEFDILAALVAGGGNARGVGGSFSVTESTLVSALDSSDAVDRTGTSGPAPVTQPTVGPVIASLLNPQPGDALVYSNDGMVHNSPPVVKLDSVRAAPRYNGQSIDPRNASSSLALTGGSIYCIRVDGTPGQKFVGAAVGIVTAGATLTAGQNFIGVYLPDGRLVGKSRDLTVPFTVTGPLDVGLIAQSGFTEADMMYPAEGYVYVAIVANGTTKPAIARGPAASAVVIEGGSDALAGFSLANSAATATDLPATMPRMTLQPPGLNGVFFAATIPAPDPVEERFGLIPGGTSSGNVKLNAPSPYMLFYRLAARRTGWLEAVAIETRAEAGAGASYVGGTFGTWHVRFYEVGADGFPDLTRPLNAGESFNPNTRQNADSTALGTADGNCIVLPAGFLRTKGQLFAVTIENTDADPATNYASCNFLYQSTSLKGAQGRNELNAAATDTYYGLDPREGIGKRGSSGSWLYPGGEQQNSLAKWLPTFVQGFAGGIRMGQPYFSTGSLAAGTYVCRYRPLKLVRLTKVRLLASAAGNATVQLKVNSTVVKTSTFAVSAGDATDLPVVKEDAIGGDGIIVGPADLVETSTVTDATDVVQTVYPLAAMRVYYLQGINRQFGVSGTSAVDHPYAGDTTRSLTVTPVGLPLS